MAQTPPRVQAYVLTEAGTAFCKKMAGAGATMGQRRRPGDARLCQNIRLPSPLGQGVNAPREGNILISGHRPRVQLEKTTGNEQEE